MYTFCYNYAEFLTYEPVHEKANDLWFRPGPTQTGQAVQSQHKARSLKLWI